MVCGKYNGCSSERFACSSKTTQALFLVVFSMPGCDASVAVTLWQGREQAKGWKRNIKHDWADDGKNLYSWWLLKPLNLPVLKTTTL